MTLANRIKYHANRIHDARPQVAGHLTRVVGLTFEAVGVRSAIGSLCGVETASGEVTAEVVGFDDDVIYLMPHDDAHGVLPGARVRPLSHQAGIPLGMELLGRVIDGAGNPLDGKGPVLTTKYGSSDRIKMNPLVRRPIRQPLDVGVTAINGLITVGQGQRMGLFAGSGVGKSVLMGMMTRGTTADVIVVGLVGERGREVK